MAVYLRAAWSLGPTQNRYIFSSDGGDQFTGRVLAGLPILDKKFAVIAPHFRIQPTTSQLMQFLPNYSRYPPNFIDVVPWLYASLIHHFTWLDNNLSESHPLRFSAVWRTGIPRSEEERAALIDCPVGVACNGKVQATGVPLALSTTIAVSDLATKLGNLEGRFEQFKEEMKQQVSSLASQLPTAVADHILKHFDVNGAVPLTEDFVRSSVQQVERNLSAKLDEFLALISSQSAVSASSPHGEQASVSDGPFTNFQWGNRVWNPVPEHFAFPSCSVTNIWDMWFYGDPSTGVHPLRKIVPKIHLDTCHQQNFSRAKGVVHAILDRAVQQGLLEEASKAKKMERSQLASIFAISFDVLLQEIDAADAAARANAPQDEPARKKRRVEDRDTGKLFYNTIYKDLTAFKLISK